MSKKFIIYALSILVLALALSACERSASNAPLSTATTGAGVVATSDDPMEMLRSFATQTAQALSGTVLPGSSGSAATPMAGSPMPGLTLTTPVVQTTPLVATQAPITSTAVPAASSKPASYSLQEGEYPYCIARRFNVNPDELLSINGLGGGGLYVPGLVLQIPQSGNTFPGARSLIPRPATYTVASYDTIYKIACKYGDIDPLTIAAANNLVAPYTLRTGQVITIP
jgi:LysM repeat protein